MRAVFFLGLFVGSGCLSAQTVLLPTWLTDSLIYEVKLGRQCNEVMKAQSKEIEALGKELMQTTKALTLSQSESQTLSSLLGNQKEANQILVKQNSEDKRKLKAKLRKRTILVIGQTVLIVILLI